MTTEQTAINYEILDSAPRLLMEAKLKPLQGDRFQPTGFADLGPARYTLPEGIEMVLVESVQSVANRMELACWDLSKGDLISELNGLPYIRVTMPNGQGTLTSSILEAHRINSPYILEGQDKSVERLLKKDRADSEQGPVNIRELAKQLFKYDPNSVIHGVFLAKSELAEGRLRLTRLLGGFIEAHDVRPVESGGAKNDHLNPRGDTSRGFGNVLFHRTEFVAREIKAFFNLDLALLRGYGLPPEATKLLIALSLFKVRRFLSRGLRLRSACDLGVVSDLLSTSPTDFAVPSEDVLLSECKRLIDECGPHFADPRVTEVVWNEKKQNRKGAKTSDSEDKMTDDGEEEEES